MNNDDAPKVKSPLRTILLTSFFTALFLILIFAGGAYWLISQSSDLPLIDRTAKSPENKNPKPTPRHKKQSPISASEITKVELHESISKTRASAAQYFGNVNPANFVSRSTTVSFSGDGTAVKVIGESGAINGIPVSPTPQKSTGAITREKFAELARVFVENDFLGEEDSKTSTSLPESYTLIVTHSAGEKKFKTSNTGNDTPEAEAMLRAFRSLETSVNWKYQ